jgi:hypothetical protein
MSFCSHMSTGVIHHIPEGRWCLEWPRDVFICHEDIWTYLNSHEIQSNSPTKGFFWTPQNNWTSSINLTDTHDGVGRTWNYSVCVIDSVLSIVKTHIQMLTPDHLTLTISFWDLRTWNGKWLYHTDWVWKLKKLLLFYQYQKILSFVLPPLVIQMGGIFEITRSTDFMILTVRGKMTGWYDWSYSTQNMSILTSWRCDWVGLGLFRRRNFRNITGVRTKVGDERPRSTIKFFGGYWLIW